MQKEYQPLLQQDNHKAKPCTDKGLNFRAKQDVALEQNHPKEKYSYDDYGFRVRKVATIKGETDERKNRYRDYN